MKNNHQKHRNILMVILFATCCIPMANAQKWKTVKCGGEFTIGIKEDGSLWGWGMNGNGQLGFESEEQYVKKPRQIFQETDWKDVAAGSLHTIAIKNDGTLWGCGLNSNGQTGLGENDESMGYNRYEFEQIGTDTDWVAVEACYASSYAIKRDGSLWAWGYNLYGMLGTGNDTATSLFTPTKVGTQSHWVKVSAGGFATAAIDTNGHLYLWGLVFDGADYEILDQPFRMTAPEDSNATFTDVSVGWDFMVALRNDSTLWASGSNYYGCLGELTDSIYVDGWTKVCTAHNWTKIRCGSICAYAINDKGEVYAWGGNLYGQLGFETPEQSTSTLTRIEDVKDCRDIQAAKSFLYEFSLYGFHTCLLKEDGSLCNMGSNYVCQLGRGEPDYDIHTLYCEETSVREAMENNSDLLLFPNPCHGQVTVSRIPETAVEIMLTDATGRLIRRIPVTDSEMQISMQGLADGIYFLQVSGKENRIIKKIVKNTY